MLVECPLRVRLPSISSRPEPPTTPGRSPQPARTPAASHERAEPLGAVLPLLLAPLPGAHRGQAGVPAPGAHLRPAARPRRRPQRPQLQLHRRRQPQQRRAEAVFAAVRARRMAVLGEGPRLRRRLLLAHGEGQQDRVSLRQVSARRQVHHFILARERRRLGADEQLLFGTRHPYQLQHLLVRL